MSPLPAGAGRAVFYAAFFANACLRRILTYVAVVYGFEVLGGGTWSGFIYLGLVLPYLLSVSAGSVIDAAPQRRVLRATAVLSVVLFGLLAAAEHGRWLGDGSAHGWLIAGLVAAYGVLSAFSYPAYLVVIPGVFGPAAAGRATAIVNVLAMLCYACGPLLAGFLRSHLSWSGLFASLALLGLGAWGLAEAIPLGHQPPAASPQESEWARLRQLLAFCRRDRALVTVLVTAGLFTGLVVGPLEVLVPLFARTPLDYEPFTAGLFMATGGAGLVAGAVAAIPLIGRGRLAAWLTGASVAGALCMIALSLASGPAAFALLFAGGMMGGAFNTLNIAGVQALAPDALRGRVLGLYSLILGATPALGGVFAGWLATATSPAVAVRVVFGSVLAVFTLFFAVLPALQKTRAASAG